MFTEERCTNINAGKNTLFSCIRQGVFFLLSLVLFLTLAPQKSYAEGVRHPSPPPAPVKKLSNAQRHALSLRAKFRPELKKLLEQDQLSTSSASLQPVRTLSPTRNAVLQNRKTPAPAKMQNTIPVSARLAPQKNTPPGIRVIPMPPHARPVIPSASAPVRTAPVKTAPVRTAPVRISPAKTVSGKQPSSMSAPAGTHPAAAVTQSTLPVRVRLVKIGNDRYCFLNDLALYYRMRIRYYRNGVELFAPGKNIRFYNDKRTGSINNVPVSFLYPPVVRAKTQYFIHEKDVLILLASTMSSIAVSSPVSIIMLDPGHGGTDHGALGTKIHEKQMNLNTALLVRAGLTRLGYKVKMTRSKDKTLTLDERTAICAKMKPDLFVSIHCNAAANKNVSGIETFAATPFGTPSTGKKTAANIKKADPGNAFDRNNYRLAYEIQKSLISQTSAVDRGVKVARYKVIRDASCPAALVEIGFITNGAEQKRFINPTHRKKIVDGLVLGIHNYAKSLTVVKQPVKVVRKTIRRGEK